MSRKAIEARNKLTETINLYREAVVPYLMQWQGKKAIKADGEFTAKFKEGLADRIFLAHPIRVWYDRLSVSVYANFDIRYEDENGRCEYIKDSMALFSHKDGILVSVYGYPYTTPIYDYDKVVKAMKDLEDENERHEAAVQEIEENIPSFARR